MKTVLLFTIIVLLCNNASAQGAVVKSDLTKLDLNGRVKSIRQVPHDNIKIFTKLAVGKKWPYRENNHYIIFNERGNIIEKRLYDTDGNYYSKRFYNYDERGNRTEKFSYNSGHFSSKITYKYDKKGNITESIYYNHLNIKFISKYDKSGNVIEKKKYYGNGDLYFRTTYEYDQTGNRVRANVYTSERKLFCSWSFKYDEHGNMIKKKRFRPNGSLDFTIIYTYDEKGNRMEWKYNSKTGSDSTGTYEYEYDAKGNWIKKTIFEQNKPCYTENRKINYY